jgi:GTP-binding protein
VVAVHGGRGGKGNEHFKSATMRAPRFAQPGEPGDEVKVRLELKILADAGLVGLPNAGKSTFITNISAAKPKIAPYPFTTLQPNLGVMLDDDDYDHRLVVADIPGLIEGAHMGAGLGHQFLRHIERTRFLVHILSIEDINLDDPWSGFELINEELSRFAPDLKERSQIEVVNKIDLADAETLLALRERADADKREIYFISALNKEGVEDVARAMWRLFDSLINHDPLIRFKEHPGVVFEDADEEGFDVAGDAGADDLPGVEVIWTRE